MSDRSAAASPKATRPCKARKGDSKSKNVDRKKGGSGGTNMTSTAQGGPKQAADVLECAVCLQSCVHPVELPCGHVFCFLCMKGASTQYRRCALCRQEIPVEFFTSPKLLREEDADNEDEEVVEEKGSEDRYTWFYEGRNGWWQYDERTDVELEESYRANKRSFELLIAGYLYMIDLDSMLQYRRADPSRRRRIKRDLISAPKKGIAGLKIKVKREEETREREVVDGAEELKENPGAVGGSGPVAPTRSNNGTVKAVGTPAQDGTVPLQEGEVSDESRGGTDTTTPRTSASRSSVTADDTVYEVMRTTHHKTADNSPPSYRYATPSQSADPPPTYALPQPRPRNDSPPTAASQTVLANVSPPTRSASAAASLGLTINHQRTHSAPETSRTSSSRPRCPAPPVPPQRASSRLSSQSQSQGPRSSSSSSTSQVVDGVMGVVQSQLVINVDAANQPASSRRRRQGHRQVHEV